MDASTPLPLSSDNCRFQRRQDPSSERSTGCVIGASAPEPGNHRRRPAPLSEEALDRCGPARPKLAPQTAVVPALSGRPLMRVQVHARIEQRMGKAVDAIGGVPTRQLVSVVLGVVGGDHWAASSSLANKTSHLSPSVVPNRLAEPTRKADLVLVGETRRLVRSVGRRSTLIPNRVRIEVSLQCCRIGPGEVGEPLCERG